MSNPAGNKRIQDAFGYGTYKPQFLWNRSISFCSKSGNNATAKFF
jgi:hypothetical protein